MANSVTTQLLIDGQRNVVVKFEGVLDTSDLAATGTIGASGFTTVLGSNGITFVAGALAPVYGQYLTFGDGTTTFSAGTYVTSIISATQITVNNLAKANNTGAAITITGTAGAVVVADPLMLSGIMGNNNRLATGFIINKITHNVEDLLSVNLFWEETTNVRIEEITGRGNQKYVYFGGLAPIVNAGYTGKIVATTQGWVASSVLSFSLIIELIKM